MCVCRPWWLIDRSDSDQSSSDGAPFSSSSYGRAAHLRSSFERENRKHPNQSRWSNSAAAALSSSHVSGCTATSRQSRSTDNDHLRGTQLANEQHSLDWCSPSWMGSSRNEQRFTACPTRSPSFPPPETNPTHKQQAHHPVAGHPRVWSGTPNSIDAISPHLL